VPKIDEICHFLRFFTTMGGKNAFFSVGLNFFCKKMKIRCFQSGSRGARFLRNFVFIFKFAHLFFCEKKKIVKEFRKKRAPRDPD
tara:strand:+ start:9692 stop:9946 length:255 start_codon:yes stop_codon:yes gene_type:complete